MLYGIRKGYRHRTNAKAFDDTKLTDQWQKEVYELAAVEAGERGFTKIIDVGCGSAFKLMKHFEKNTTYGVEIGRTINWLRWKYPKRNWLRYLDPWPAAELLICADVIEHVANPDRFLDRIDRATWRVGIFSTPDRVLLRNLEGPPRNQCHYREWTRAEFAAYMHQRYRILWHGYTNVKQSTQTMVVIKK